MDNRLALLHNEAHLFLETWAKNFRPGIKLTLLARYPDYPGADVLVTDDKVDQVIEALNRLKSADKALAGEANVQDK